jgi:hypothetical protein
MMPAAACSQDLSDATRPKKTWPCCSKYLERFGRPLEFYTDKASLFSVNRRLEYNKDVIEDTAKTQIGRALEELGIGWVAAHSPQAKGRVERSFETAQDRLVKGLRVAGVTTLEQANHYLETEYLPQWETKFTVVPAAGDDAHRPLGLNHDLAAILCRVEERVVTSDYRIRLGPRSSSSAPGESTSGTETLWGRRCSLGRQVFACLGVSAGGQAKIGFTQACFGPIRRG